MIGLAIKAAFQLKSSTNQITKLILINTDLKQIEIELTNKIEQSPSFFKNFVVIIDLQKLTSLDNTKLDLLELKKLLLTYNIIPLGVINGTSEWQENILNSGLHDLSFKFKGFEDDKTQLKATNNKLIMTPIRSGEQIYAPHGDIIVFGQVGHGSELVASGNIHVYGNLRGRALAGINGDIEAKIFCLHFNAELIAIAGNYQVNENIAADVIGTAVMVTLVQENLQFLPLSVTNKKD